MLSFFRLRFLIFSLLFSAGWLAGYGFSRSRYFTIFWSVFLLAMQIIVVSKTAEITAKSLILPLPLFWCMHFTLFILRN